MKIKHIFVFLLFSSFPFFCSFAVDSKGAIIIASMEGQVAVKNNETGNLLPQDRVKVGGLIFDGHTVETGKGSKVVLLFSSGTITTLKEDSVLNIKKFTQEKFDPKAAGKLSARNDEPSPSETVIDLSLGDMVVDVKKLKKESSFNIDSPVGTAGIRGTIPRIQVAKLPGGGFNQTTQMLKGKISYMPKGGGRPTMLGPGQSLASGISASGQMLAMQIGRVPSSVMKAIQAEVDKAGAATGKAVEPASATDAPKGDPEEDAPSEDELNEVDDERQASAKGLDDNGSKEAIALEKTGLIDLEDDEQSAKVDNYIEVAVVASSKFEEKVEERRSKRRAETGKTDSEFVADLVTNFDDVVDVTIEADTIGVKDDAMFDSLLEDAQNAADVKEVVQVASTIGAKDKESLESVFKNVSQADSVKEVVSVAADLGAQDKDNLGSVFKNADKADDLKAVMVVAKEALGSDDGSGTKKLDPSKASILSSTLKNADKADSMKSVMDDAADLGAQDAANLTSVFQNADKADDLKEVMNVAKQALGSDDGTGSKKLDSSKASILSSTLKNADKAAELKSVMETAADLGAQDAENLTSVFSNADKAADLKAVMDVAKETLGTDDGTGTKKLDSSKASILSSTLKNADKAAELKSVMETAADLGAQDAENLTSVFSNADKAADLKAVMDVAKETLGTDDGTGSKKLDSSKASILSSTLKNADKAAELKSVMETAADLGAQDAENLTSVFSNADKAADLKAVMDVAKEGGATQNLGTVLQNADKASDMRTLTSKAGGNGDLLNTVFANADKASDLKAVVEAADNANTKGASVDVSNLLANADKADKLKELAEVAESAGGADGSADLLSEVFGNADKAEELAAVMEKSGGDIETQKALLRSAEQAEALALAVQDAEADAGTSPANFDNLFAVVKQVDQKKQRAKALEEQVADLTIDTSTKEAITSITSISGLKSKLTELLTAEGISSEVALNIFKAKDLDPTPIDGVTPTNVETLLNDASITGDAKTLAKDLWVVINARKESLISEQGFQNIKTLTDIAASSGGSAEAVLDTALENVEQVNQLAVLIEAGGDDTTLIDQLATGGDAFDFDEALESGALSTLKSTRFTDQGYTFNEIFSTDQALPLNLSTDYADQTAVETYLTSNSIDALSIQHIDGSSVYELTAEQVNALTGSTDGVAGKYKFDELLDADTGAVTGVSLSIATKKLGVEEFSSFSLEADRAGDVLFVLDSPVLKAVDGDDADKLAQKANYREKFINNVDQIDNLIEISKVLGEDPAKIDVVFNNLSLLNDLTPLTQALRNKPAKLSYVFEGISGETDETAKAVSLSMFNSLVQTYIDKPAKLDKIFIEENFDYLPTVNELSTIFSGNSAQVDLLFNNIDKAEDLLLIANRFEGTKRDTILSQIQKLSRALGYDQDKRNAIFENPSQASSLSLLYDEFKNDLSKIDVIFQYADKADAFLSVLNDLKGADGTGNFSVLFTNPLSTMEDRGLAKLKAEYPEKYHAVFDENKEIAAEIAATASKFKNDESFLDLVFTNLDKLNNINAFANEFGGLETIDNPDSGESIEKFVYDEHLMSIFFANIGDLSNLIDFKSIAEVVGIPGSESLLIFDVQPDWLSFVLQDGDLVRGADGKIQLNEAQRKAGKFLSDLYFTDIDLSKVSLALAGELLNLNLTKDELALVVSDLIDGPLIDQGPDSAPPSSSDTDVAADIQTLSFLLDHEFSGTIDPNLVVSADVAMASTFFEESLEVYDALSMLGNNYDEYIPQSESDITDSSTDGTYDPLMDPNYDGTYDPAQDSYSSETDPNTPSSSTDGTYDPLMDPNYDGTYDPAQDSYSSETDPNSPSSSTDGTYNPLTDPNYDGTYDPAQDPHSSETDPNSPSSSADGTYDPLMDPNYDGTYDPTQNSYSSETDPNSPSSSTDGMYDPLTDPNYDGTYDPAQDSYSSETDPNSPSSSTDSNVDNEGVLGGRKLSFGSGSYDLSNLSYDRLLFAARDHLSLAGDLTFSMEGASDVQTELLLLSAGGISFENGTDVNFKGDSLGFGSFNSMNVIGVDLYAKDEISLRSLDRLVLNNVSLSTSGLGSHDGVELLAHQEISVDNLRFNEHIKRIAMEAQTVNLRNLNFPSGSTVKLNSAYGPLDGKYPNFNSIMWGRVNFITNIRYADNLIMTRPAFDTHGGNISIGTLGN